MLLAVKVVDRLDGIEGTQWYFDEDGVPVGHGTIPKPWELKGL